MSTSQSPLTPRFFLMLELCYDGCQFFKYDRGRDETKKCWFTDRRSSSPSSGLRDAYLFCPGFNFAEVAAGLPETEAIIDALHHRRGDVSANRACSVNLIVNFKGGFGNRAVNNLLGKKIATLVMLLEESLLLKLVAPHVYPLPVSKMSNAAQGPWPQGDVVSSEYASHVPRMEAMEPAAKKNRDLELMYRKLGTIWSAPLLQELQRVLYTRNTPCDFNVVVPNDRVEEDLYFRQCQARLEGRPVPERPETETIRFRFEYMQMTFEHTLLRNWVEIIARIIELALAGPDEYKRCLEAIFRIQYYETNQGSVAWEQLMKHVLNLEHCIPDWRDQLARYEQGEVIGGLSENGLLPKRMDPFYSQPSKFYREHGFDLGDDRV